MKTKNILIHINYFLWFQFAEGVITADDKNSKTPQLTSVLNYKSNPIIIKTI